MSVYRYVKRTGSEAAGADMSSAVEVTLTNPGFKAELDRTMDRMGFEFAGSRPQGINAVAPGFPASAGLAFSDAADRPTPVAGSARVAPPPHAAPYGAIEPPVGQTLDAAALGIAPSWEELPEAPLHVAPSPEPPRRFRFLSSLPRLELNWQRWAWLVAAFVPVLLVQGGVLGSAPSADDYIRLYDEVANGFVHAVVKQEGVHSFPLNRLIVWVLHRLFSLHTTLLFLVPLALHFACVVLLRQIVFRATNRAILSAAIAITWGISPIHRGTLSELYSIGAIVASCSGLYVVSGIVGAESRGEAVTPRRLLGWSGLAILGALCASTGTAFALAMPLVALLYASRESPVRRAALGLLPSAVLALALYVAFRVLGPPEPLGKFIRGLPLFFELFVYGTGNFLVGPFVVVAPGGEPAGVLFAPGPTAAVICAGVVTVFALAAAAWALARGPAGGARRAGAFAVVAGVVYLFDAFDGAKNVVREGMTTLAVKPEAHYLGLSGIALAVAVIAAVSMRPMFRRPFVLPAVIGSSAVVATLFAWVAASHVGEQGAPLEKGMEDVERALERAVGATEQGHEAYLENVEFPVVPRSAVGRDRLRFPGLLSYFALAHPAGELAGRSVHFVENDAKLVAALRESAIPRIAALVESSDEARKKNHAVTTPRLSRPAGAPEAPASARRPARSPTVRERKRLPSAKP